MPPKGHSRRSTRGAKPPGAPDSSNSTGHTAAAFKDEEPTKPRRGAAAKARTASYQLDEPKPSGRGSKLAHPPSPPADTPKEDEDDEGGETRCVCDQAEAETKDMGFMVQCEECEVWQHGICMGIEREEDCPEKYYCELCRPDLHPISPTSELSKRSHKGPNKKAKSIPSSRTSRSTSPLPTVESRKASGGAAAANKVPPKRRNTMNSRETDLEHVLDLSRKEAERAGLIPEAGGGSGGAASAAGDDEPADVGPAGGGATSGRGRKRKRVGESESGETSRKKRAAGSPDSVRSEHGAGEASLPGGRAKSANKGGHSNQSPALPDAMTPEESAAATTLGRGRRARKEKELPGMDPDGGKLKHPNQYTYRGSLPIGNNIMSNVASSSSNINNNTNVNHKPSPAKPGKVANNDHVGGTRKGGHHGPQASRHNTHGNNPNQQSPSPVPLSYNVPDHFAHLVPLLPHPTPQGVSVPIRVELLNPPANTRSKDNAHEEDDDDGGGTADPPPQIQTRVIAQTEKGVKVRWPPKRTTIGEMRRRVRAMMEYVARAQLDAGERERRVEMLRAAVNASASAARATGALLDNIDGDLLPPPPFPSLDEQLGLLNVKGKADLLDSTLTNESALGDNIVVPLSGTNPDGDMEMVDGSRYTDGDLGVTAHARELKTEEVIQAALDPDEPTSVNGIEDGSFPTTTTTNGTGQSLTSGFTSKASSPPPNSSSKSKPRISTASLVEDPRIPPSALISPPSVSTSTPTPTASAAAALRTSVLQNSSSSSSSSSNPITPASPATFTLPTTTQLLDELTRELIQFQERFGAGREGKVYSANRVEARERRTRGAPVAGGGADSDMF